MSLELWRPGRDFEAVVDTLEPVTLHHADPGAESLEALAWRFEESTSEAVEGVSGVLRIRTVWQLPLDEEGTLPRPGDDLIDTAGQRTTLVEVRPLRGETRVLCRGVAFRITPEVVELVDVLRPVWGGTAEGPVVTGYAVQQAEVRCCVAPASELAADDDEAPATPLKFYFEEPLELRVSDRIRRSNSATFGIVEATAPTAAGDPYVVVGEAIV